VRRPALAQGARRFDRPGPFDPAAVLRGAPPTSGELSPIEATGDAIDHQGLTLLVLAENAPVLGEWHRSFLRSISDWTGELTPRQRETLLDIIEKAKMKP
jgi:hypothetical protein